MSRSLILRQLGSRWPTPPVRLDALGDFLDAGGKCLCTFTEHSISKSSYLDRDLYFVYHSEDRFMGSVILRTIQVSQLLNSILGINSKCTSIEKLFQSKIKNSILVLSKSAIRAITHHELNELAKNKNLIISDQLDRDLKNSNYAFDHFITTDETHSSFGESKTTFIPHAPDWRLKPAVRRYDHNRTKKASIAYLGSPDLYLFQGSNVPIVRTFFTSLYQFQTSSTPRKFSQVNRYSFHLTAAARKSDNSPRPSTKIVNAVKVGSLPIIGSWEPHARKLLGHSYPLTIKSESRGSQIMEIVEFQKHDKKLIDELILSNEKVLSQVCPIWHALQWQNLIKLFH